MTNLKRRLIVNADDFGRSPGVNRGVIQAFQEGIVTSTTLIVNLDWATDALAAAAEEPALDVGLHVNLCYGPAVASDVGSLIGPDGNLERDLHRLAERINPADVDRELRAQLDRFIEIVGRLPTHIDSHHHMLSWPACREALMAVATEHELPVRSDIDELRSELVTRAIITTDHFQSGFYGPGNISPANLIGLLEKLEPGTTELMCHPGYADEFLGDSAYSYERETELAALTAVEVREKIAEFEIDLFRYSELTG